jgi:hypothetical protein
MNTREKQRRRITTGPKEVTPGDVARAYHAVAQTEDGAIMIADLVRRFGFARRSTFVEGDSHATARNEGQRTVLQHIGFMQDVDPAAYEQSMQPKGQQ